MTLRRNLSNLLQPSQAPQVLPQLVRVAFNERRRPTSTVVLLCVLLLAVEHGHLVLLL